MCNVSPGKFANPLVLIRIRPDLLLNWLWPMRDYLHRRGLNLPAPGSGPEPDSPWPARRFEQLAKIFMEPTPDMPAELLESLFMLRKMATPSGMDMVLKEADDRGIRLETGPEPTPADVALIAWNSHRQLLEDAHTCHELHRARSYQYFSTHANPVPEFAGPTEEQMRHLHEQLSTFYQACKRGPGVRVFSYHHEDQWCFLVRHGAPCCREGAMEKSGEPTTIFYRPQKHDVLIYDVMRGEMGVHCCSKHERQVLLRLFGKCLFGRPDFFPGTAKYTLAPLVRRGRECLACADVPRLERVRLTRVEFFFPREPWHRSAHHAADIFRLIEGRKLAWPEKVEHITRATFEVKFRGSPRPRQLVIVPCNQARFGNEEDMEVLELWLQRREFMKSTQPN